MYFPCHHTDETYGRAAATMSLAYVLQRRGSYEEARGCNEKALAVFESAEGDNSYAAAAAMNNLANLLQLVGNNPDKDRGTRRIRILCPRGVCLRYLYPYPYPCHPIPIPIPY